MAELEEEKVAEEITFSDDSDEVNDNDDVPVDPKKRKRRRRIIIFGIIAAIIAGLIAYNVINKIIKDREALKNMYTDVAVERRTITKSITGSSSIEPNDSYNVMTMKSGDITADYFKEGDTVKKGDKLYQFDDEDARTSLSTAQNAVVKAEQSYVDAVKQKANAVSSNNIATKNANNSIQKTLNSLNDAKKSYEDQYVTTDIGGKVTNVTVKEGDTVGTGTHIADIYDDSFMKLRLPFNDYDAESVEAGDIAEVTVTGSGDVLYGTVTEKAATTTASSAHTMVVYVTIEVANPGALTESDRGSAVVNDAACADSANFEYYDTQTVTAKTSGTLKTLEIDEGDSVYEGEQIAYIESDTINTALSNAQLSYDDAVLNLQKQVIANDTFSQDSAIKSAKLALDDAKTNLKKAEDAIDDFVVEAPIEGTVVKKNAKNGDTRDSSNSTEALCVIYDLSSLKMSIEVDETEIALVKTGLKAKITADAVDGEFEGEVTKVPVDGVNTNGVTTYTIEVQINDYGDLLPGMNVDAEIVVEEAADVLTIPVNSVNRGNIVFVKDDGNPHVNDVTDRIKNRSKDNGDSQNKDNEPNAENGRPQGVPNGEDGNRPQGAPNGEGGMPQGMPSGVNAENIPGNIEIPEGYRAIQIETGINDTDYIEVKSGLTEEDSVRTLNTKASSAGASFGAGDQMDMQQMRNQRMRQMQGGGMSGGMGGAPGGGMGGGPR